MGRGCGAPGNSTIGSGKMGRSRSMVNTTPKRDEEAAPPCGPTNDEGPGRVRILARSPARRRARRVARSGSLGRAPEALEGPPVGGFPQLFKRALADLPNALPRHPHQGPDLLERHRLAAFLEAVIEVEDLALAGGEILLEDAIDDLAHQLAVGLLLDLAALLAGEPLA